MTNHANYDCVAQVYMRIDQYLRMGHAPDKLEVLVLGGTFTEYPEAYQKEFVRDIYYGANTALDRNRAERFPLETEVLLNENAVVEVIGLTLETRPDTINMYEIASSDRLGVPDYKWVFNILMIGFWSCQIGAIH